ncbi:hypothetical protein D3C81_1238820 [compost metagenome]
MQGLPWQLHVCGFVCEVLPIEGVILAQQPAVAADDAVGHAQKGRQLTQGDRAARQLLVSDTVQRQQAQCLDQLGVFAGQFEVQAQGQWLQRGLQGRPGAMVLMAPGQVECRVAV